MIPVRTHAIIDYIVGIVLIIAPFIFRFAEGAAMWVPLLLGIGIIIYSLLTRYELSAAKLIPLPVHLGLDVIGGLFLIISPWLFGFAHLIWWPHVVVGLAELIVVALTDRSRAGVDTR